MQFLDIRQQKLLDKDAKEGHKSNSQCPCESGTESVVTESRFPAPSLMPVFAERGQQEAETCEKWETGDEQKCKFVFKQETGDKHK